MPLSRRNILIAASLVGAGSQAGGAGAAVRKPADDAAWLQSVVERYASFGAKASGGPGDEACGAWLEGELTGLGYACERQVFQVPFFEATATTLACGSARAEVTPQALVVATGPQGIAAPLRRAELPGDLTGAIALVALPFKRWTGISDPQASQPIADAFRRGALAAVVITTGPSGEAIALNVTPNRPGFDRPVVLLAPKDARPFVEAAAKGEPATLTVAGRGGRRPAWNLIARLDRKAGKTLILSTPRSGWFNCVAERGSGLAVWLGLAGWLAKQRFPVNLDLVATSGHEYVYFGGERYLAEKAPKPARTRMWVHIGASLVARDWHELGGDLRPLPSADPQRVLTATPDLMAAARKSFKGLVGLEAVYPADRANAGGELVNVIEAGYPSALGEYGGHRYFHTRRDDLRCVSGDLMAPVLDRYRQFLASSL